MNESKANRISKLEEHRAIADQKKEYCGGDFMDITDEFAERVWEIVESFGSYRLPDGTLKSRGDDLLERIANRPKCTCKCSH